MWALRSVDVLFTFFVDFEEICIRVFKEKSVKVSVKFLVEFCVARRTKQARMVNSGGESMSYHEDMMKLDYVDG